MCQLAGVRKPPGNRRDTGWQPRERSFAGHQHSSTEDGCSPAPTKCCSFIKDEGVEFVDIRFTDLPGTQQHLNTPAQFIDGAFFTDGIDFDGSSIRGFAEIHKSDMKLIPDPATAYVDPFRTAKTLNLNFSIVDPRTGEPYERDPRQLR